MFNFGNAGGAGNSGMMMMLKSLGLNPDELTKTVEGIGAALAGATQRLEGIMQGIALIVRNQNDHTARLDTLHAQLDAMTVRLDSLTCGAGHAVEGNENAEGQH